MAFRFFFVAVGFYLFSLYSKQSIIINKKNLIESLFSGVLFHGFYLGGVFYALSKGISVSLIALLVSLQPILTSMLARIYLNETLSKFQWLGIFFGFSGAFIIILPDIINGLTAIAFFAGFIGLNASSLVIIWQKQKKTFLAIIG